MIREDKFGVSFINSPFDPLAPVRVPYLGIPIREQSLIDEIQSQNQFKIADSVLSDPNAVYRQIQQLVTSPDEDISTGDGQGYVTTPFEGQLVAVDGRLVTASSSGSVQVALENELGQDILAGWIEFEANIEDSLNATNQPFIEPNRNIFSRNELIKINIDSAGTSAAGLIVNLYFVVGRFYAN